MFKTLCLRAVILVLTTTAHAFELHGSSILAKNTVMPNKAKIEAAASVMFNVVINGSGNGLKGLIAGKANMAMISAPLDVEAALTNTKEPGSLDITGIVDLPGREGQYHARAPSAEPRHPH